MQGEKASMVAGPLAQELCSFWSEAGTSVGMFCAFNVLSCVLVIYQWYRNSQWCKHVLWNPWGLWKRQFTKYTKNGFEGSLLKLVSVFNVVGNDEVPSDANILSETLRVYERDNLPNIPKMALGELCWNWLSVFNAVGDDEVPNDANILSEALRLYERDNLPNIPKMALRDLCWNWLVCFPVVFWRRGAQWCKHSLWSP